MNSFMAENPAAAAAAAAASSRRLPGTGLSAHGFSLPAIHDIRE